MHSFAHVSRQRSCSQTMHTRKRLLRRGVAFEEAMTSRVYKNAGKQKSKHAGPSNLTSEVVAGKRKGM